MNNHKVIFGSVLLLAGALLSSCKDSDADGGGIENRTLGATLPKVKLESRIQLDVTNTNSICSWDADDSFVAYNSKGAFALYSVNPDDIDKNYATFTTSSTVASPNVAIFPTWMVADFSGVSLTMDLPDVYTNNSHSQNAPMIGQITDGKVDFKYVAGLLRISFKNLPQGYNTIKVETNRPIAGRFTLEDVNEPDAVLREQKDNSKLKNIVTIKKSNNGEPYYLPLPAGKYDEIHIYAEGLKSYQIYDAAELNVESGCIYNIDKDFLVNATDQDFLDLMEKIRIENISHPNVTVVDDILAHVNKQNGSFNDIDYKDHSKTNWQPMEHLDRLMTLASAYIDENDTRYFANEELKNTIEKGLAFWTSSNTYSDNWWHEMIQQPKLLGLILIKMRAGEKKLDTNIEKNVLNLMEKEGGNPFDKTGANRTDISTHWLYRAALTSDREVMTIALNSAFSTICYTSEEGFQHDGSFHQHGPQLYIGGYGDEILKGTTQLAKLVSGGPFALSREKTEILSRFVIDTYYNTVRGRYMSFSVMGRSVSRPNTLNKQNTANIVERMLTIDPKHTAEYNDILARLQNNQISAGLTDVHTHFFRSDYTLHVRKNYTFDVRMVSKYTSKCERGNGENLKGYFMSDGSTNILVDGNEYYNIFPVWKWAQVPGVTAPDYENSKIPWDQAEWGVRGTSDFAGGTSDGKYGVSAYSYYDNKVKTGAQKSWFFFDDEVVCMGVVNTTSNIKVNTTINQCLNISGNAPVVYDGTERRLGEGNFNFKDLKWAYCNKVGYVFPKGGDLWLRNGTQSGTWNDINDGKSATEVSARVFALGLDNGLEKNYSYIVVPGITSTAVLNRYVKDNPIEIVMNTDKVQSVFHKDLKIWQIVSFVPDVEVACHDLAVKADKPCVLMITEKEKEYKIYVADPSRKLSDIHLELSASNRRTSLSISVNSSKVFAGQTENRTVLKSVLK